MEILSIIKRKARKTHLCDLCGCVIEVGETYGSQVIKSEGDFYTWRSHVSCDKISNELDMHDSCDEGLTLLNFKENIRQEYKSLMQKNNPELFDSNGFALHRFKDQLSYVKSHYGV